MKRQIHSFVAFVTILSLAGLATLIIISSTPQATAVSSFGGFVTVYSPSCITVLGKCSCSLCGTIGACDGHVEIQFTPAPGSAYTFICPIQGYPYRGGTINAGVWILGNGPQQAPIQVGVSK